MKANRDIYRIVQAMRATGNRPGVIRQWKESVEAWASSAEGQDAAAIRAWLPSWQDRPFYSAAELAPIIRILPIAFGWSDRPMPLWSPKRLENELRMARLPHFMRDATLYFMVERCHMMKEHET